MTFRVNQFARQRRGSSLNEASVSKALSEIFQKSAVSYGALLFERADGHYKLGSGSDCFPEELLSMCDRLVEENRHPGLLLAGDKQTPFTVSSTEPKLAAIPEIPELLALVAASKYQNFYFLPVRDLNGNLFVSAVASRERVLTPIELRLIHSYCLDAMEKLCAGSSPDEQAERVLTPRERECLTAAAKGLTEKLTAELLSISPYTVHAHLENCKRKLGARNKLNAIVKGLNLGEIMPGEIEPE